MTEQNVEEVNLNEKSGSIVDQPDESPEQADPSKLNGSENGGSPSLNRLLSRDSILSVKFTRKIEKVEVPEWGGFLFVKEMTGRERDRFELSLVANRDTANPELNLDNARARLIVWTACDESGNSIFSVDDIPWLGNQPARVLQRIYGPAQDLSSLNDKAMEELTKSLGEDRNANSGSN